MKADLTSLLPDIARALKELTARAHISLDKAVLSVPLPLEVDDNDVAGAAVNDSIRTAIGPTPHRALQQLLGVDVLMGNDTDLAALGEARWGAGRGKRRVAFLRVVSGLGVGIVSDGLPVAAGGVTGGEIAHVRVSSSTRQCLCGDVGCWINEADNDLGLPAMLRNLGAPVRSMADVRAQMSSRTALTLKAVQDFGVSLGRHLAVMFLNLRPRVL